MSRIDEALKRAAGHGRGRVIDVPDRRRDEANLEDYPREARASQDGGAEFRLGRTSVVPPAAASEPAHADRTPPALPPRVLDNEKLVASTACDPVSLEQYRRIAASLHELQTAKGLKTVIVTSSVPREGKTLTAVNLALTFSESYHRRVLLIDADLRRPSLHEVLGVSNDTGLSELLTAEDTDMTPIPVERGLDVLPAGQPARDPLAGLSSDRLGLLLDRAASRYDWVILDTPPLGLMSDAQILGRLTQAAVFVIRAGSTPFPTVNRVLDGFGRDRIVGLVLNGVDAGALSSAADYYSYYHDRAH